MNLYGRFIIFLICILVKKRSFDPFKAVKTRFRVWLHDIDINIHLTAARYFSFGDLGRFSWLGSNGLMSTFMLSGYQGVINAQEITYIREFKPLSRVTLEVELICWDEKYGYFEQRYYCRDKLYAVAHSRMAILYRKKVVSFGELFHRMGYEIQSQPETEVIKDWKETLRAKRAQFV